MRVCISAVQSVLRESQVIRESKEEQIAELKKMLDLGADSLKNEWEKKVCGEVEGLFVMCCGPASCKQKKHHEPKKTFYQSYMNRLCYTAIKHYPFMLFLGYCECHLPRLNSIFTGNN